MMLVCVFRCEKQDKHAPITKRKEKVRLFSQFAKLWIELVSFLVEILANVRLRISGSL